jgi:hypothetical protein
MYTGTDTKQAFVVNALKMKPNISRSMAVQSVHRSTSLTNHRTPAFGLDRSELADPPQIPDIIDMSNVVFHAKVILTQFHMVSTKRSSAIKSPTVNASTVAHRSGPSSPVLDKNSRCIAFRIS